MDGIDVSKMCSLGGWCQSVNDDWGGERERERNMNFNFFYTLFDVTN